MPIKSIEVIQLSKKFRIGALQKHTRGPLSQTVLEVVKEPWRRIQSLRQNSLPQFADENLWALRDVSFEINHGEVVGLIGGNGAGKSTLLKILSRITPPSSGKAILRGRVAALLEVGTGFNPELTGRENIYLNGSILGMRKKEIDRVFDEIVYFAGVEKFIDTPIKRFSSGMGVRLGFAVAAHLQPEILLVDEVLAVGDAEFQRKCLGKMDEVASSGRTVILVSHNMSSILGLCGRTLWLDKGQIQADGDTQTVVYQYLASGQTAISGTPIAQRTDREGNGGLRLTGFSIRDSQHQMPLYAIPSGSDIEFVLEYERHVELSTEASATLYVKDDLNKTVVGFWTRLTASDFKFLPSKGKIVCKVPRFPLTSGTYALDVQINGNGARLDGLKRLASFDVVAGDFFHNGVEGEIGEFFCDHSWEIHDDSQSQ